MEAEQGPRARKVEIDAMFLLQRPRGLDLDGTEHGSLSGSRTLISMLLCEHAKVPAFLVQGK